MISDVSPSRAGASLLTPPPNALFVEPIEVFEVDPEPDRGHQVENASRERPPIVHAEIILELPTREKEKEYNRASDQDFMSRQELHN